MRSMNPFRFKLSTLAGLGARPRMPSALKAPAVKFCNWSIKMKSTLSRLRLSETVKVSRETAPLASML